MNITCGSEKGARLEQEDRFIIHSTPDGVLLAVMDGHGGEETADVCHDFLGSFWDLHAKENRLPGDLLSLVFWQLDSITNEYHSGCTMSLAFVPNDMNKVYWATLGDSPVIVRSPNGVNHVSTSHNARTNAEEAEAAVRRGGKFDGWYVFNGASWGGMGLQMTRALGDSFMGPILSRVPDIQVHDLGDFLLLATDGLFDPAHQNELGSAADIIALIDGGADAEVLVDHAVKKPTGDNATAILLRKEVNEQVSQ